MIESKWIKLKIENYISKVHKKETGGGWVGEWECSTSLTNEPSNNKRMGNREEEGGEGRRRVNEEKKKCMDQKKNIEKKKQEKNRIIQQGNKWSKKF